MSQLYYGNEKITLQLRYFATYILKWIKNQSKTFPGSS